MVKLRYFSYLPNGLWSREVEIQDVSIDGRTLEMHFVAPEIPGIQYIIIGDFVNSKCELDFGVHLIIDDTEYDASRLRKHFSEVQVMLDRIRTERLLQEISRDD